MFVKICGLRDLESARVAVEAGADALGFILAESRRQVAPETIAPIRRQLSAGETPLPQFVGVTVNASPGEIRRATQIAGLDAVQLSGDEDSSVLPDIDLPVAKMLRFPSGTSLDAALREVEGWLSGPKPAIRVMVEGHVDGSYGGTGSRADWVLVAQIAERYPIVLAGGLTPDNVVEAVSAANPAGVDVSSGVETDGVKDHEKIRIFIAKARRSANDG